jgi:hypothetical protein
MATELLPAVSWSAVSTDEQADEDKSSLQTQHQTNRANAAVMGAKIVHELTVPGRSRYFDTIAECAAAWRLEQPPVTAFDEILEIWARREVKMLFCRDADRFARTLSMGAEFVNKAYRAGVTIYSDADGHQRNVGQALGWIAQAGLRAQKGVLFLVDARRKAMPKLAERGLYVNGKIPPTHQVVRDANHKRLGVVIDTEFQHVMYMAAALFIEGVPYPYIETELFRRYGIGEPSGRPYPVNKFLKLLTNPYSFGHVANGVSPRTGTPRPPRGLWMYEPGHPVPAGVDVTYNTHQPVFDADTAQAVIAEIERRAGNYRGKPYTHLWTRRLFICAECRNPLVQSESRASYQPVDGPRRFYGVTRYLRCVSSGKQPDGYPTCSQTKTVRLDDAQTKVTDWLRQMIDDDLAARMAAPADHDTGEAERLEREIARLRRLLDRLIIQKAEAPDGMAGMYDTQMVAQHAALTAAVNRLDDLNTTRNAAQKRDDRRTSTIDVMREEGIDAFWDKPAATINATLLSLLDGKCFAVENGEVVGFAAAPMQYRTRTRRKL